MIVLEQIKIDSTDTTPQIVLDVSSLNFSFCGVSMPNDPVKFYAPIIQWLKE